MKISDELVYTVNSCDDGTKRNEIWSIFIQYMRSFRFIIFCGRSEKIVANQKNIWLDVCCRPRIPMAQV
jgi:hypothetical protein